MSKKSPTRSVSPKRKSSPKVEKNKKEPETLPFMPVENVKLNEANQKEELKKLAPGETNWFGVFTSLSFIIRLIIVLAVMITCAIIILNVTCDASSTSWYNQLYKPDWIPDGITFVIIFSFLSFLLAWCWYRFSQCYASRWVDLLFIIILGLQLAWTIVLYSSHDITAAKYLISFYLGFAVILLVLSFYVFRFSDVALYSFLYMGWLILVLIFTFDVHELTKEYKLLGIVKDKNSSLYKRKMKMEAVNGIKVSEDGVMTEFNPLEQE